MSYTRGVEGNVIHADFSLHGAHIAMDRAIRIPSDFEAPVVQLPTPVPEELYTIINYLKSHHIEDFYEIDEQISQSLSLDTPGHAILEQILTTIEFDRPILFEKISRLLTGVN